MSRISAQHFSTLFSKRRNQLSMDQPRSADVYHRTCLGSGRFKHPHSILYISVQPHFWTGWMPNSRMVSSTSTGTCKVSKYSANCHSFYWNTSYRVSISGILVLLREIEATRPLSLLPLSPPKLPWHCLRVCCRGIIPGVPW